MHDASPPAGASADGLPRPEPDLAAAAAAVGLGSRALRNTALVLSARVASRALALVTVIAVGNHLHPALFGEFQTLVNYTALVTVVVDLGFNTIYVREAARRPRESGRFLSTLVSVRAVMAILAFGVLALVLRIPGLESLLLPGFALLVLSSFATLLRGTFYALQRLRYEAISIVLESAVLLGLVIWGVRGGAGVAYFIWAYAASSGVSCLFILVVLLGGRMVAIRPSLDLGLARRWFWNGLPFALTFVITTVYFRIDVPILQHFRSFTEVGWYTFAYKPFESLLFIPVTMLNVAFPVLSVYFKDLPQRVLPAVEQFYRGLLMAGWPLTVGTFVLAPGLNHLLRLYDESEPALEILALGIVFMFVASAFIGALNAIDRQASFTRAALASLLVNVGLNVILIPRYGYLGAAWATVLTEIFLVAAGWALTARHLARVPLLRASWRILVAGLVMGAVLFPLRGLQGWAVLAAVAGGALVYAACLLAVRAFDREDIALIRRATGRPARS